MSSPTPDQFDAFYEAVHEKPPFPWQSRLAKRVCGDDWPRAIALPTAAGKTVCIDIAVFALACMKEVRQPRRIFFVVDRRIVVDQAFDHAKKLAKVLDRAPDGVLRAAADALRNIAEPGWLQLPAEDRLRILRKRWAIQDEKDEAKRQRLLRDLTGDERQWFETSPLDVYALRGGMYRESAWARSPLQPTVIASTVDQVGSRLLFRGYGVSPSMMPVHAGLVGNDALILLDEAHCAKPFDQTMQAVERYRAWGDEKTAAPFKFVSVTATPNGDLPEAQIERDNDQDRTHPVLGTRITASKPAALVVAEKAKGKSFKQWGKPLVEKLAEEAKKLATEGGCVGIIVNRVATARALKKELGADAELLTGRMRSLDRDRLLAERLGPLFSDYKGEQAPPKFVVGTQCLECGADFDFHALVTECASLDALRQRFGRLNRIAARPGAKAVIVVRADQAEVGTEDPVYGTALANAWQWLNAKAPDGVFDFGVSAVRTATEGVELEPLNAPAPSAPVLFPTHLDCWVQTHPMPTPDPDPALFLHGPKRTGQPDVQVVFRADLGDDSEQWPEIVGLCPPSSSEAVAVPIGVFKRWLAGEDTDDDTPDVEGGASVEADDEDAELQPRRALRWRGPAEGETKTAVVSAPKDVTPNDTYVVPCSAPGAERLGDFPPGPVGDYAAEAFQRSRDKALLRLPDLVIPEDADKREETELLAGAVEALADDPRDWVRRAAAHFGRPENLRRRELDRHPLGGYVLTGKVRLHQFDPTYLDDTEPGESFRGRPVTLEEHSQGVAGYARRFAAGCGLEVELFTQAGLWHDLGKLDPRFQAMLRQSSPRTVVGEPLAKSGAWSGTRKERDEARAVHGYPKGARHELLSAALVSEKYGEDGANDLLLHLIATHHGSARPFANAVDDPVGTDGPWPLPPGLFGEAFPPVAYRQDVRTWNAELPERFWRVVRKWGWWGASYREAVFRLADHAQSAAEQDREPAPSPVALGWVALPAKATRHKGCELTLKGLDGANPLGFLAALGTLRLASELFPRTALRWEQDGCWRPVLVFPAFVTTEVFVSRLHERVHRNVDGAAQDAADQLDRVYRTRRKATEQALKSVKERKLRGREREQALEQEVFPLVREEQAARCDWLDALEQAVPAPFLSLGRSIAVTAQEFRAYAERTAERMHATGPSARADADFAPAFGCECCVDRNGRVVPTAFQLVNGSGHQFFLDTFGALMLSVRTEQLNRALLGAWTYADARLSFRWDPVDDRRYAVGWGDPSATEVRTEHGANLLAAFALPLLPVIPTVRGARTTGFDPDGGEAVFSWPIWENNRGADNIRSLLQSTQCFVQRTSPSDLDAHQVAVVYRVRKYEVGTPPLSKLNLCAAVPI